MDQFRQRGSGGRWSRVHRCGGGPGSTFGAGARTRSDPSTPADVFGLSW